MVLWMGAAKNQKDLEILSCEKNIGLEIEKCKNDKVLELGGAGTTSGIWEMKGTWVWELQKENGAGNALLQELQDAGKLLIPWK